MRIIAGDKRGAALLTPPDQSIRPTSDKTRGAIFNILAHASWCPPLFTQQHQVLDVFCGTGAFALEALSRGAGHACLIDQQKPALDLARANANKLGYEERCRFLSANATQLPAPPHGITEGFDLVFLDPPYHNNLVLPCLNSLMQGGWLAKNAVVVVETAKDETLTPPNGFMLKDNRRYGAAQVHFLVCAS